MTTTKIIRTPSTPIQRLASRLLRQRGYSLSQISAITDLSSATVFYATVGISADNLQEATLDEVGAPGNSAVFSALLAAATEYADRRLARREVSVPRGFRMPPTATTAEAA